MDSSHPVVNWGTTTSGSQRYFCKSCKKAFTWKRKDVSKINRFSIFESWLRGTSVNQLASFHKKGKETIRRIIQYYLENPPSPKPIPNLNCNLIIDGTWFKKSRVFIIFWDHTLKYPQYWVYATGEKTGVVHHALSKLKEAGVVVKSVTSDGGSGIRSAVKLALPEVPHQRCLVHLARRIESLTTTKPKTEAGKELRYLAKTLYRIDSKGQRDLWVGYFKENNILW